jgi:hypothetical protein
MARGRGVDQCMAKAPGRDPETGLGKPAAGAQHRGRSHLLVFRGQLAAVKQQVFKLNAVMTLQHAPDVQ